MQQALVSLTTLFGTFRGRDTLSTKRQQIMNKKLVAMMAATMTALAVLSQTMPTAPEFLKKGDKVAILSLASTPKKSYIDAAKSTLRQWGYVPVVGQHVLDNYHGYAGTPRERLDDLLGALRDPDVKAIISTRGGYGSAMMLGLIHPDTLARYPKWIIGYSDITALHSAQVRAGNMSIHANMCGNLASKDAVPALQTHLRQLLGGTLPTYSVPAHPYNQLGHAHGILLGGNMAVFSVNFSGSAQWDFLDRDYIAHRDIILFFEDVSESMPRVASMLTQLRLKGVLDHVKGIMVGRFTDYSPSGGYADMNQMLHEMLQSYELDIPICYDFPASHDESWNYPLVEGCPVTLDVTQTGVTLRFTK